jgi:hypothetical protein
MPSLKAQLSFDLAPRQVLSILARLGYFAAILSQVQFLYSPAVFAQPAKQQTRPAGQTAKTESNQNQNPNLNSNLKTNTASTIKIYQTSTISGDFDVLIDNTAGKEAVKIVDRKGLGGLLASAPNWDIVVFNNKFRRQYQCNLKTYAGLGKKAFLTTGGYNMNKLPLVKKGECECRGIKGILYSTKPDFEKKQQKDLARESAEPRFPQSAEMVVNQSKIAKEAAKIIARFYGVPESENLPIQFKFVNLKGELHYLLITNSLSLESQPAAFQAPQGYTRVDDISKLEDKVKEPPPVKFKETVRKIK